MADPASHSKDSPKGKEMMAKTEAEDFCKCQMFKDALKRCDIFHKVQYGSNGAKYSWGYYTDEGTHLWKCPFCGKELDEK